MSTHLGVLLSRSSITVRETHRRVEGENTMSGTEHSLSSLRPAPIWYDACSSMMNELMLGNPEVGRCLHRC